jgi:hypothetical protein
VRSIFQLLCKVHAPQKLFVYILDGLKSKNAKQRTGMYLLNELVLSDVSLKLLDTLSHPGIRTGDACSFAMHIAWSTYGNCQEKPLRQSSEIKSVASSSRVNSLVPLLAAVKVLSEFAASTSGIDILVVEIKMCIT